MKKRWIQYGIVLLPLFFCTVMHAGFNFAECLRYARANNPSLAALHQAVKTAEAGIEVSRAETGPNLDFAATAHVTSVVPEMTQPEKVISGPAGDMVIPASSLKLGDYDSYSLDVELRQMLYAGGRLTGAVTLARNRRQVAGSVYDMARNQLDRNVGRVYIFLERFDQLKKVAADTLKLARTHEQDVLNLVEAGVVTENERLKAELRVSEAESDLVKVRHQIELQVETLRSLTGWEFSLPEVIPGESMVGSGVPETDASVAAAWERRPELVRIHRQIVVLKQQEQLAKQKRKPIITAFGKASYGKPGPDFIRNEWIDSYQAGLRFNLNLWDNGRISAELKQIQSELQRLEFEYQAMQRKIKLEVIQSILGIDDALARIEVARRAETQAEENYRITSDRFNEGTLSNTDFLDAEIALSRARTRLVIAETDLHSAWMEYKSAMGLDLLEEETR